MSIRSYKELKVWQKAIKLVVEVYKLTEEFPVAEKYGLCSQMRRAAVAIPSNIAEGYKRKHLPEYLQFLRIADRAAEIETQIIICQKVKELKNLKYNKAEALLLEVQKMLSVMIKKLGSNLKT